jgi:tRNA threonylcarbamoyladenosine biosynthesis protein TsaB
MYILAVDTSSERGSICVRDNGETVGELQLSSSIQHSERLFRSIEFLFQYLPFRLADIDVFAAARGPGSFTGLRVGLAAMEGFAAAFGKRGAGVSTLEALAWRTKVQNCHIAPTIDARRGEIYGGLYRRVADELIEERIPVVLKPAQWFQLLPDQPLVLCGDGALRYWGGAATHPQWTLHRTDLYLAGAIAEIAARPGCGPLEPLYLRKTDAEVARERHESIAGPHS